MQSLVCPGGAWPVPLASPKTAAPPPLLIPARAKAKLLGLSTRKMPAGPRPIVNALTAGPCEEDRASFTWEESMVARRASLGALSGVLLFWACKDDTREVEVVGPLGPTTEAGSANDRGSAPRAPVAIDGAVALLWSGEQ